MASYYIRFPSEIDLSKYEHVCVTESKKKISIDPGCKCSKPVPVTTETSGEAESRRRDQRLIQKKLKKEEIALEAEQKSIAAESLHMF